jgi:hypothetical protein
VFSGKIDGGLAHGGKLVALGQRTRDNSGHHLVHHLAVYGNEIEIRGFVKREG